MEDDRDERITFGESSRRGETRTSGEETRRVFSAHRWTSSLILIPMFIVTALLAIFFFAVFLALFVVAAGGLGLWFWWLRRKLHKAIGTQTLEGDYVVVEKTPIIEKQTDKLEGQ